MTSDGAFGQLILSFQNIGAVLQFCMKNRVIHLQMQVVCAETQTTASVQYNSAASVSSLINIACYGSKSQRLQSGQRR